MWSATARGIVSELCSQQAVESGRVKVVVVARIKINLYPFVWRFLEQHCQVWVFAMPQAAADHLCKVEASVSAAVFLWARWNACLDREAHLP